MGLMGLMGATGPVGPRGATGETGAQGPQGVPGPSSRRECPGGMTRIESETGVFCVVRAGEAMTWDQGSQRCFERYSSSICTIRQLRITTCYLQFPFQPGPNQGVWTADTAGGASFALMFHNCNSEAIRSLNYNSQQTVYCCAEWMKY